MAYELNLTDDQYEAAYEVNENLPFAWQKVNFFLFLQNILIFTRF